MAIRSQFFRRALGLVLCLGVLGIWAWIEITPTERIAPPPGKALVIDKSPRAQDERKALIDQLLDQGHLRRIDPVRDSTVRVSLRPTFYLMDVPTRTKYADAIYRYYFDGSNIKDTVILRDGRHGNEIGRYNPYGDGLSMSK